MRNDEQQYPRPMNPHHFFVECIPQDIKLAFKACCARRGKSMRNEVIRFMKEEAEKFAKPIDKATLK